MKNPRSFQPLALAAILLAAGCNGPATDNQATDDANVAGAANEMLVEDDEAVEVAALPDVPAGLATDEAAPLAQATEIASEIADDEETVERVPFEDGWAWRRNGQTIRTASRDGRRVSYFRPGEAAPFFVQQGEEAFAYSGGRVQRAYDRGGRPAQVAPARREEAQRLADNSRRERERAQRAPRPEVRPGTRPGRSDGGPGNTPPRPGDGPERPGRDRDDRGDRATPPTPPVPGAERNKDRRATPDRRRRDVSENGMRGDDSQGNRQRPRD